MWHNATYTYEAQRPDRSCSGTVSNTQLKIPELSARSPWPCQCGRWVETRIENGDVKHSCQVHLQTLYTGNARPPHVGHSARHIRSYRRWAPPKND
jgi:hypothetical protein